MRRYLSHLLIALLTLPVVGCENPVKRAVREISYSGYEMIGVQKRDLLKRDITQARDEQKEAGESFGDSLETLRHLYALPDSELSSQYRTVQSSFKKSEAKAAGVRASREKMQTVAKDLFREWRGEIDQIQTPDLRRKSQAKLKQSQAKFAEMDRSLGAAQSKMEPVLTHLRDHVLFLKHNLNAESLTSLKGERDRIAKDIDVLIRDMKQTVARADEVIQTLR